MELNKIINNYKRAIAQGNIVRADKYMKKYLNYRAKEEILEMDRYKHISLEEIPQGTI